MNTRYTYTPDFKGEREGKKKPSTFNNDFFSSQPAFLQLSVLCL